MKLTKEMINLPGFVLFRGAVSKEDSAKLTHGFRSAVVEAGVFGSDSKWTLAIETAGTVVETLHLKYGTISAVVVPHKDNIGVSLYSTRNVFFGNAILNIEIKLGLSGKSYRTALGHIFKSVVLADKATSAIDEFNKNYKRFIVNKVFA